MNDRSILRTPFLRSALFAVALALIAFYLIPFLIVDTGSGMFFLLAVIPLLCFFAGLAYGIRDGFRWYFALLAALLFLPAIPLHFNSSALVYAPVFGALCLLGNFVGSLLRGKRQSK